MNRISLKTLREMPHAVAAAASVRGGVEVTDENGEVRFRLVIPSEPIACPDAECERTRAELTQLRQENHRLSVIVDAASEVHRRDALTHIRLRDGLRRACDMLDAVDWLTFPGAVELQEQREAEIAELRQLLGTVTS